MNILITGASGFIGSFIVEEALRRGMDVWAAVRPTSSRKYLADPRIHFLQLDLDNPDRLAEQLQGHSFDYVVHAAGATKCICKDDFRRTNTLGTRHLANALLDSGMPLRRFVFVSSLSVMGAGDEKGYAPFTAKMIPMPDTRYGVSKLKAETYLQTLQGFPYIIFRATGVYGPHERDYYMMMRCIKAGFDFSVGFRKQLLTFIYVKDLACAVFDALESGATRRKTYLVAEPRSYTQREFRHIVAAALHKRWVLPVCCPLWMLYVVSAVAGFIGKLTLKPSTLNSDKYKIMKQRNWACDTSDAERDFGFAPQYDLERGVAEAVAWYKQAGWL